MNAQRTIRRRLSRAALLFAAALVVNGCHSQPGSGDSHTPGHPGHDTTVTYDDADPRLAAAAKDARANWPTFVTLFQQDLPNRAYYAKAGFPASGGSREYLWLRVTSLSPGQVTGRVNSTPEHGASVTEGQTVSIAEQDVCDWMVHEYRVIAGDFQARILEQGASGKP